MHAKLVAILFVAACGGGQSSAPPPGAAPISNTAPAAPPTASPAPPPSDVSNVVAAMNRFSSAMCKCPDRACADRVTDEMTKWGQDMARNPDAQTRISEADTQRIGEIAERMTKCMTAAMSQATGSGATP